MTLAFGLGMVMAGCNGEGMNVTDPSQVEGATWRLSRLERADHTVVTIATPDRYTLTFTDETRLAAHSDCNQCGGTYQLRGESFTVGPLACTKAFCGEASLDSEYSSTLADARAMTLDGGQLVVRTSGGAALHYTR